MGLYKTNVALAIDGDRIPRGTEVELSDDQVAHLDPADIELVGSTPEAAPEKVSDVPLEEMGHAQLKARAKELGLSASGSKSDLQERIALHLQKPEPKLVDFVVTEEYLAEHADCAAKVGDTIQVPEEEITNDN